MNIVLTISIFTPRSDEMTYIKVLAIESHFSENDILIDFDKIQAIDDRYIVFADGEAQLSFPIKEGYKLKQIKSIASDEYDVVFTYFKYLKEV
jgi:hypothetical protein